jgi:hypothetical protein
MPDATDATDATNLWAGEKTGTENWRGIVVRNEYKFGRQLTDVEVELLKELITWRPGSSVTTDPSGAVVGCFAALRSERKSEEAVRWATSVSI